MGFLSWLVGSITGGGLISLPSIAFTGVSKVMALGTSKLQSSYWYYSIHFEIFSSMTYQF